MSCDYDLNDPPDVVLAKRAAAELGLSEPKARLVDGHWIVSGYDGRTLRLFHPVGKRGWEELTVGGER